MDKKSSRRSDFDQGYSMISKLESACLLVGCKDSRERKFVKMHDLIRDVAIWVTRENPRFMVKSGMQLRKVPLEEEWAHDLNRVSLMHNLIESIPDGISSPRCPSLSSLYLNNNPYLRSVADSFFMHMKSLHTLDLSDTAIVALPDSVSLLVNLKAMLLRNCRELVSLPSMENLKALTDLDLCNTSIVEVIHGLESLTNLKCLEFKYHNWTDDTAALALRGSSSLQRLILSNYKLVEVKSLRHIEEFQGRFASTDEFRQFIISMNSRCQLRFFCHVLVGEFSPFPGKTDFCGSDIGVNIKHRKTGEIVIDDEMMLPLRDISYVKIDGAKDMKCLLRVSRQDEEVRNRSPLERLKELYLFYLPELKNIIEWVLGFRAS